MFGSNFARANVLACLIASEKLYDKRAELYRVHKASNKGVFEIWMRLEKPIILFEDFEVVGEFV